MHNLGLCFKNGDGVEKDPAQAAKWFRAATLACESSAMVNLGQMHEEGEGVERDLVQAYAYYKVAALDFDDRDAKRRLAKLLKSSSLELRTKGDQAATALKVDIAAAKKTTK